MSHPGTIVFAEIGGASERSLRVEEVPHSVAFVQEAGVEVPVTRVVAQVVGDQRLLKSYAADGRLLSTTTQRR